MTQNWVSKKTTVNIHSGTPHTGHTLFEGAEIAGNTFSMVPSAAQQNPLLDH